MKKKSNTIAPSIRTYLLVNLLLSVTLITSLAIVGNLFLAHQDIREQLDQELIRDTVRMQAIFSSPINPQHFADIQSHINSEEQYLEAFRSAQIDQAEKNDEHVDKNTPEATQSPSFQIWDANGKLVLHSKHAAMTRYSNGRIGLSSLWLDGHTWRVCTGYNTANHLTIMMAERMDIRQALEDRLTQDSVVVMLITYPFLGFLIWAVVGRGLNILWHVAEQVRKRAPTYLDPVDIESVPSEIEPLVSELNALFRRLQAGFDREKRFTADAAHELKTPLAALSAQTQVALRAQTELSKKEALIKVLFGVRRATHVVQQLLTLSRMEPQDALVETALLSLSRQAADVVSMLAPDALEKNIELSLEASDEGAFIRGNTTALDILIRNLIDNAVRYSPENSEVQIEVRADKKYVILIVSDNGPGIPEKLRTRVFERFFRIMGNTAMGSGLGLSIVQQIAKLHHATIELHTPKSGKGIEFWVIFPRAVVIES